MPYRIVWKINGNGVPALYGKRWKTKTAAKRFINSRVNGDKMTCRKVSKRK